MARQTLTCVKASSGSEESSLFKSWSAGVDLGHNGGGRIYTLEYMDKYLLVYQLARQNVIRVEASSGNGYSTLFQPWSSGVEWWGHNGRSNVYIGKIFTNVHLKK